MKITDTLRAVDLTALKKPMAVIYSHSDNLYTVRVWDADTGKPGEKEIVRVTLGECRREIREAGFMIRYERAAGDAPEIVESWM